MDLEAIVKDALAPRATQWGLDVGIQRSDLYFMDCKPQPLKTHCSGRSTLKFQSMEKKPVAEPIRSEQFAATGSQVAPLNDNKQRRKDAKKAASEQLEKWFGLPRQHITPELELEMKAIKLRGHFDPKRFYKGNDSTKLPTHFQVGVVYHQGGLQPVGEGRESEALNAHTGRKKFKGKSLLQEILANDVSSAWTKKEFRAADIRGQSGHKQKTKKVTKKNWKRKKR